MNKKPYAWLDGIPDKTSDLYNDAGYLNENEVDNKCREWLDLDNAEDGQVLSVAVDGDAAMPYWTDVSGVVNYSKEEQDTGLTWIDGKKIYQKTFDVQHIIERASYTLIPSSDNVNMLFFNGVHHHNSNTERRAIGYYSANEQSTIRQGTGTGGQGSDISLKLFSVNSDYANPNWWTTVTIYYTKNS